LIGRFDSAGAEVLACLSCGFGLSTLWCSGEGPKILVGRRGRDSSVWPNRWAGPAAYVVYRGVLTIEAGNSAVLHKHPFLSGP
jgi:hypothetical protein